MPLHLYWGLNVYQFNGIRDGQKLLSTDEIGEELLLNLAQTSWESSPLFLCKISWCHGNYVIYALKHTPLFGLHHHSFHVDYSQSLYCKTSAGLES